MRRAEVGGVAISAAVAALVAGSLLFGHGPSDARLFWLGGAALLVTAVGWAVRPVGLSRAGVAFFAVLGAFVFWQALSIHWSIQPAGSWDYANRTLVYLGFASAGALAAGVARERIAEVLAALLGLLFVVALVSKVVPFYGGYTRIARLNWPLQYWNELALLAAGAVPVALWLSARRRVAGSLLLYAAVVTVVLTFSRFGIALAVLAALAWLALERDRLGSLPIVTAAVPLAGIVAGIGLALPGVGSAGQSHATRLHDGLVFGAVLLAGAVAVTFASRWSPSLRVRRLVALRGAAALAVLVVAALVVLAVRAGGPIAFVQARWHEFTHAAGTQSAGRIGSASSGNRWQWWQQAWHAFLHHPGGGTGAGTFALTSTVDAHNSLQTTIEPHNTPLQFLSETGIVGFLLYACLIASAALALVRRRDRATVALALFALVAVVHSVVDIDWDFVATQGPLFALAGALVARPDEVRRARWLPAAAIAVVCLAAFYSLFAPWWANKRLEAVNNATSFGDALSEAKEAHSLNPLALEPLYLLAGLEHNVRWMEEAVKREPRNPEPWYELAAYEWDDGHVRAAYDAASRSYQLDRFGPAGQPGPGNVGNLARCKLFPQSANCPP
jgi:O-antigen ligase